MFPLREDFTAHRLYPPQPAEAGPRGRPWLFAAVCGLTVLVYAFGLVRPYNVFALGLLPGLTVAALDRGDVLAQVRFVLTTAALFALYLAAWRLCLSRADAGPQARAAERAMGRVLAATLVLVNFMLLWLYPVGAADVFDNISHGRITSVWGGNPFYDPPGAFPQDPFLPYVGWQATTSAYGPAWELLAAGLTLLAGSGVLANLLAFKLLGILFYGASVILVAGILQRRAPHRALAGAVLLGLNPLVLYETAGNGHNDSVLVFCLLLAMLALSRRRHAGALLALTAGALVKYIPLLLVPIVAAYSLRRLETWPARLRYLVLAGLGCALLAGAALAPFWRGDVRQVTDVDRRMTLFTTSLPALAQAQLQPRLGVEGSRVLVSRAALGLTGLASLLLAWHTWRATGEALATLPGRRRAWLAPVQASLAMLLFYLLVTGLWFQAWYGLWPLALAALLPPGALAGAALLLAYSAAWKSIIFDTFVYRGGPLPPRLWRETLLAPAVHGLTWLYVLAAGLRQALRPARGPRPQALSAQPENLPTARGADARRDTIALPQPAQEPH